MDTHAGSLSWDQVAASVQQRASCGVLAAIRFIKHREDLLVRSVVNFIQI
jgi:hypothetical protein